MSTDLQTFIVCPNLLVICESKILLLKRADTALFYPGYWHIPTGKIAEGESPSQAIIREAFEEVGLTINPELGTVVSINPQNFRDPKLIWHSINLFYVAKDLQEAPINKEPHMHSEMDWFDVDNLPTPIIPTVKYGIEQYKVGKFYGEFGYPELP